MRGKILLLSLAAGLTWASAQGVRQLGMGGVILPGPAAAGYNPAYALFPPEEGEGFPLPLGLLRLALPLFPDTSPVTYFTDRLIQIPLEMAEEAELLTFLNTFPAAANQEERYRNKVRGLIHLIVSMPRHQLK